MDKEVTSKMKFVQWPFPGNNIKNFEIKYLLVIIPNQKFAKPQGNSALSSN